MSYKLDQIVLENEKAFCIALDSRHFECYEIGVTHSVRKAQIITDHGIEYVKKHHFLPRWGEPTITDKSV